MRGGLNKMNQRKLIIGIVLSILGILIFIERGYFASALLGAHTLGNMGLENQDDEKLQIISAIGGIGTLAGIILTIITITKKGEK